MTGAPFLPYSIAKIAPTAIRVVVESSPRMADGQTSGSASTARDVRTNAVGRHGLIDNPWICFQTWQKIQSKAPKGAFMAAAMPTSPKVPHAEKIEFIGFHLAGIEAIRARKHREVRNGFCAPRIACLHCPCKTRRQPSGIVWTERLPELFTPPGGTIRSGHRNSAMRRVDGSNSKGE